MVARRRVDLEVFDASQKSSQNALHLVSGGGKILRPLKNQLWGLPLYRENIKEVGPWRRYKQAGDQGGAQRWYLQRYGANLDG